MEIIKNQIVINTCYGGYSLSKKAYEYMRLEWDDYGFVYNDDRSNPKLIECVKVLGKEASGDCSNLKIVEIKTLINAENIYDGIETVTVDSYCDL